MKQTQFRTIRSTTGWVPFSLNLDLRKTARSITKSALAALVDARECIASSRFDMAADFVRDETALTLPHALRPDTRQQLQALLGTSIGQHALAVSDSYAGLVAVFVYFGVLPLWVRLDADCRLEGTLCHRVDPVKSTHQHARLDAALPLTARLLATPPPDEEIKQALAELLTLTSDTQQKAWIEQAVNAGVAVFRALPEGTLITEEHINEAVNRLMEAVRLRMGDGPIETDIDGDGIMHLVGGLMQDLARKQSK